MSFDAEEVKSILDTVPNRYRGPGGAIAVLKDGQLVAQKVWGYADMERRIPMSSKVLFPVCSITKQFVSALLLDLIQNPPSTVTSQQGSFDEQMLARLREVLPRKFVDEDGLKVDHLVDMCSGLRDYWALCTLQGSLPESPYLIDEHNPAMLRRIQSLHFQPGSEYSYSNTNFNLVERLIEHVTREPLNKLLTERILKPAGMNTAHLCPRTDRLPAPIVGYEGSEKFGFIPAPNYIEWSADAGLVASLDDMIAYEQYFDRRYSDPASGYSAAVKPRHFKDGAPAKYRYGLRHASVQDKAALGHGGALRGFKLMRRYVEPERLSVVVMFNHSAIAPVAAEYILKKILGVPEPPIPAIDPVKEWTGAFLDHDTHLSIRISSPGQGRVKILYSRATETLRLVSPTQARSVDMEAEVFGDTVQIRRTDDNRVLTGQRLPPLLTASSQKPPVQGTYRCEETESTFTCEGEGDMLYGLFEGCYGRGPPHLMTPIGENVWALADPRAMDDTPPGDWTVVFVRDDQGAVAKAIIGCWLARNLEFVRQS